MNLRERLYIQLHKYSFSVSLSQNFCKYGSSGLEMVRWDICIHSDSAGHLAVAITFMNQRNSRIAIDCMSERIDNGFFHTRDWSLIHCSSAHKLT